MKSPSPYSLPTCKCVCIEHRACSEYVNGQRPAAAQKRQRVHFQPTVGVRQLTEIRSKQDRSNSYYSREELTSFLHEAKSVAKLQHMVSGKYAAASTASSKDCLIGPGDDEVFRGFENTIFPARQVNKCLAQRALLKFQRLTNARTDISSDKKPELIAAAYTKLSQWSKLVALETARLDSLRVYGGDYLIPIEEKPVNIKSFPSLKRKKRSSEAQQRALRVASEERCRQPMKKMRTTVTRAA